MCLRDLYDYFMENDMAELRISVNARTPAAAKSFNAAAAAFVQNDGKNKPEVKPTLKEQVKALKGKPHKEVNAFLEDNGFEHDPGSPFPANKLVGTERWAKIKKGNAKDGKNDKIIMAVQVQYKNNDVDDTCSAIIVVEPKSGK
jgi:hypothetical protein